MNTANASRRPWARRLVVLGSSVALATGFVGFLHTKTARPLLAQVFGLHCPFSAGKLSPARREALRRDAFHVTSRPGAPAPSNDALGFPLGKWARADVAAWASERHVSCKDDSSGASVDCDGVTAADVNETGNEHGSLYFRFDPSNRLVAVLRMVRVPNADRAGTLAHEERASLASKLGAPTLSRGEPTAAYLATGTLAQARVEYRFADFAAIASATNLGHDGYLLTEEAQIAD